MPDHLAPLPRDALDLPPDEIRRRFTWARRRGHPRYVWPDLPISAFRAAAREVERVTGGLLATAASTVCLAPPEEAGAEGLGVAAFTAGMGPLLGRWAEDGRLSAPPAAGRLLALHLEHGRARARRVHELLATLAPDLAVAGVRATLLKGAHTAAWFPERGCRPLADVDLLVAPGEEPAVSELLGRAGFRLRLRQRRPARAVWAPPGGAGQLRSLGLHHADGPLTLDVHVSLERDFYGIRAVAPPRPGDADVEAVPGVPAPFVGLRAPHLLLSLALHASEDVHNLQLVRLVELCLVARSLPDREGAWDEALALADACGGTRFSYPAAALAARLVPGAVGERFLGAARAAAPPSMRRLVEARTPGTALRPEGLSLEERLLGARTPAEVARRVAHMLVPASAGDSLRELLRIYVERAYRLLRGRVSLRDRAAPPRS